MPASGLYAQQRYNERVNILAGVVERQGRAHRGLKPEPAQNRLGAVMSRADRNSFLIEGLAHVFGAEAVENEREHARFLARGPDEMQPWDGE